MKSTATVTAIIPCFERFDLLQECLQSLIDQERTDWSAVVVDDASKSGQASNIVDALGDGRIICQRLPTNRGPGGARNAGFALTASPFLLQLDSDDTLAPSFLTRTLAVLEGDSSIDCVFTNFEMFGDSTGIMNHIVPGSIAVMWQWIHGAGTVLRRQVWERVGGFSEAPEMRNGDEDWEFWIAAAEQGLKSHLIPEPLYRYRVHGNSLTTGSLRYHADRQARYIYEKHRSYIDGWGLGAEFLATGYSKAALASWSRGERIRAARMALRATMVSPKSSLNRAARLVTPR